MRKISYGEAISEATHQAFELDPNVFVIGQGVRGAGYIFGTINGLYEKYGEERVIEMPLAEPAMMGACLGAAINGLRPLLILQRADFLYLILDQLVNHAAKWRFMFAGKPKVPVTIRCVVGRGWGQGPQHSQSLHSMMSHFPGVRVVMPSQADDAKGLLLNSIFSDDPVVVFEGRPLHREVGVVPEEPYVTPFGKSRIISEGNDVTLLNTSFLLPQAQRACKELLKSSLSVELIDLLSATPVDYETIQKSVQKTGRLVILDTSWKAAGIGTTIAAEISKRCFGQLKAPVEILTIPDYPTPTAANLEAAYYPSEADILDTCQKIMR